MRQYRKYGTARSVPGSSHPYLRKAVRTLVRLSVHSETLLAVIIGTFKISHLLEYRQDSCTKNSQLLLLQRKTATRQ
jgi:hypothetical protein